MGLSGIAAAGGTRPHKARILRGSEAVRFNRLPILNLSCIQKRRQPLTSGVLKEMGSRVSDGNILFG